MVMNMERAAGRRACRAAGAALSGLLLAPAAWGAQPESGTTFAAPGATIYYEVVGSGAGSPLFVANGGPGFDHTYMHVSEVWNRLAERRLVVFWDQRGNGRSPDFAGGHS